MTRPRRAAAAIVAISATVLSAGIIPHASADPLATAKAKAASLTRIVSQLNTQAEIATERYDAVQAQLNVAVAERGQADQALSAVQAKAAAAQLTVSNRARALYESGGGSTVIATLLAGGNPTQAIDRYTLADSVLAYESKTAHEATSTLAQAQALDDRDAAISRHVTVLQVAQEAQGSKVAALLATQRQALARGGQLHQRASVRRRDPQHVRWHHAAKRDRGRGDRRGSEPDRRAVRLGRHRPELL